jgi:glycosyltransferase involved in cell wall biosynthesis
MHDRSLDHLHVHFATEVATVALILTQVVPITLSMTVHGPDEFYNVDMYHLTEKIAAARFMVCISLFAQSQLMKLSRGEDWQKLEISRLGVDCRHFRPSSTERADGPVQILCVGRLVSTKGQRILIEAVERLLHRGDSLRLCLVGDGPDRKSLELLAQERKLSKYIHFAGSLNQDHIRGYYEAADIFALASFAEGIPVVLMEAMAMEIPCVATCINGIPELIRNEVDGLLVTASDVEGMANALSRLIHDPVLRRSLGRAGRLRVQQSYELCGSVDRLAELFERRLEQPQ